MHPSLLPLLLAGTCGASASPDAGYLELEPDYIADFSASGDVNGDGYNDLLLGDNAIPFDDPPSALPHAVGAAYLYLGSPEGVDTDSSFFLQPEDLHRGAYFGFSLEIVPDVNGDGYDEVLVGAFNVRYFVHRNGVAYLYYGAEDGPVPDDWVELRSEAPNHRYEFGFDVAGPGDVDGDGFGDLVVSEPGSTYPEGSYRGVVYLFLGGADGLDTSGKVYTPVEHGDAGYAGTGLASAGDVDGDGYADLLVSDPESELAGEEGGAVYVFFGSVHGFRLDQQLLLPPGGDQSQDFGRKMAAGGDVDGDGYADAAIQGYHWPADGEEDERSSSIFVYPGSPGGLDEEAVVELVPGDCSSYQFGWSLSELADADGDGYADLLAACNVWDGERDLHYYPGSPDGLEPDVFADSWWFEWPYGPEDELWYAGLLAMADLDGNGRREFLVMVEGLLGDPEVDGYHHAMKLLLYPEDTLDADGDGYNRPRDCDDDDPARYPGGPSGCGPGEDTAAGEDTGDGPGGGGPPADTGEEGGKTGCHSAPFPVDGLVLLLAGLGLLGRRRERETTGAGR